MINHNYPLTDLHRHLDGNIRLSTIWQLAQEHSIFLPADSLEKLKSKVQIQQKTTDLLAFLEKMELGVSVLASEQACFRIAYENIEDAKLAGLDYVELRFSPVFMAQAHNLPVDQVVDAVIAGCKAGTKIRCSRQSHWYIESQLWRSNLSSRVTSIAPRQRRHSSARFGW